MTDVKPYLFANYKGDHRHAVGRLMGPNVFEEMLVVVSAAYDKETNKTKLGFVIEEQEYPIQYPDADLLPIA